MSWIRRIKRGNKFYLYECTSERVNGKVKSKMIQYLGVEGDEYKVPKPISKRVHPEKIFPDNSLQAGDVTLLWEIADRLGIVNTIDWYCLGANQISGPTLEKSDSVGNKPDSRPGKCYPVRFLGTLHNYP
jgi:hypothetical protein